MTENWVFDPGFEDEHHFKPITQPAFQPFKPLE